VAYPRSFKIPIEQGHWQESNGSAREVEVVVKYRFDAAIVVAVPSHMMAMVIGPVYPT